MVNPPIPPTGSSSPIGPVGPNQPPTKLPDELQGDAGRFNLPEKADKLEPASTKTPSPMQMAEVEGKKHMQMTPAQLHDKLAGAQDKFQEVQRILNQPTQKLSKEHYEALKTVADKTTPDMQTIAKETGGTFTTPKSTDTANFIKEWLNGSQQTLSGALNFVGDKGDLTDVSSFLRLQFAVQKASQRGELFASIVGSSVSGIKTLMSTQLG